MSGSLSPDASATPKRFVAIDWRNAVAELPDADATVLVSVPEADEPVWLGWLDGDVWRYVDGSEIPVPVKAWAELPGGPA